MRLGEAQGGEGERGVAGEGDWEARGGAMCARRRGRLILRRREVGLARTGGAVCTVSAYTMSIKEREIYRQKTDVDPAQHLFSAVVVV